MEEKEILTKLANAVCDVTGVSIEELVGHKKRSRTSLARGVFFLMSRDIGIHPIRTSSFVNRSRTSCITTTKQYRGYYEVGDREICRIVKQVKDRMSNG